MKKTLLLSAAVLGAVAFTYIANAEDTKKLPASMTPKVANAYVQHNFTANKPVYKADKIEKEMINAWGIAIRPAGEGGHFWVVADKTSFEYVGDVQASEDATLRTLHTDSLAYVKLPTGSAEAVGTGIVFNNNPDTFVITQKVAGKDDITAGAKFMFASDGGVISAWTERKISEVEFDRPAEAIEVINESAAGVAFFGIALNQANNRLYAANFGENPGMKVYGSDFKPLAVNFDQPFDDNKNGKVDPGEYTPFNVQVLKTPAPEKESHVFVAYAKTQACPAEEVKKGTCKEGELFVGEEDTSAPGNGRLAEFTEDGKLVAVWNDGGKLSAPWGVAYAPADFGALSATLLVTNFGTGQIAAYDAKTKTFVDYMRDPAGKEIEIKQIWGILFGNGVSLGDTNALYFAAGPDDEADGLFGSLRVAK